MYALHAGSLASQSDFLLQSGLAHKTIMQVGNKSSCETCVLYTKLTLYIFVIILHFHTYTIAGFNRFVMRIANMSDSPVLPCFFVAIYIVYVHILCVGVTSYLFNNS